MTSSHKMKQFIEAIGQKFEINFSKQGSYIRLEKSGSSYIYIENIGEYRVCIGRLIATDHKLVSDLDIVLFTGLQGEWIPVGVTRLQTGWRSYVKLDRNNKTIEKIDQSGQFELTEFAEEWATNMTNEGWLEESKIHTNAYP